LAGFSAVRIEASAPVPALLFVTNSAVTGNINTSTGYYITFLCVHTGVYFDATLSAPGNLTAAEIQKAHLAGRELERIARLNVSTIAIEYAGDDLDGISTDIKKADAKGLAKGDPDGRQDIDGWMRIYAVLSAGDRSNQDGGKGDCACYKSGQCQCPVWHLFCVCPWFSCAPE
jgi:hypothetical protein